MYKQYAKYIVALLLFGSNGIVASFILLNSVEIVFLRTMIGSVVLIGLFFLTKQVLTFTQHPKQLLFIFISGLAMGASWIFLFEAYTQVGVSIASLIYYVGPVIVLALSPVLFKEKMTVARLIGFAIVLIGMIFINWSAIASGTVPTGIWLGLGAAVMFATMVIFNKKARNINGLENAMFQLFFSFIVVAVYLALSEGISIEFAGVNIWAILLLGVVNTGLGCYFYFSSIGSLPIQSVSILGYLEPLSALFFSFLILSENLSWLQIAGAVFILGGAAYAELRGIRNAH